MAALIGVEYLWTGVQTLIGLLGIRWGEKERNRRRESEGEKEKEKERQIEKDAFLIDHIALISHDFDHNSLHHIKN